MFLLAILFTGGFLMSLFINIPHEDTTDGSALPISSTPTIIDFAENNVYIHSAEYIGYSNAIEYTLTNTSYYWYGFSQMLMAFKLIDYEWFEVGYGNLAALSAWIEDIPPNSSVSRSFRLNIFFGNHIPCDGVYLFKKPLFKWDYTEGFGWAFDIDNYLWLHLVLEI